MDCVVQDGHRRREHGGLASPAAGRYRGRQGGEPAPAIPQGRVAFDGRVPVPENVRSTATARDEGRADAGSRVGKGALPALPTSLPNPGGCPGALTRTVSRLGGTYAPAGIGRRGGAATADDSLFVRRRASALGEAKTRPSLSPLLSVGRLSGGAQEVTRNTVATALEAHPSMPFCTTGVVGARIGCVGA